MYLKHKVKYTVKQTVQHAVTPTLNTSHCMPVTEGMVLGGVIETKDNCYPQPKLFIAQTIECCFR